MISNLPSSHSRHSMVCVLHEELSAQAGFCPRSETISSGHIRHRTDRPSHQGTSDTELTVGELQHAKRLYIAKAQEEVYPFIFQTLMVERNAVPQSDQLFRLSPTLDKSSSPTLLVIGGRLKFASHLAKLRCVGANHSASKASSDSSDNWCGV